MTARIEFLLDGAGWATVEISADGFHQRIAGISYLTNALDDLVRMGIDIATDKGWSFAEFDHEPAVTVLAAETGWWQDDHWNSGARLSAFRPDSGAVDWRMIHEAKRDFVLSIQSRDELARLILRAAEEVLERHGTAGYAQAWGGRLAFPVRAVEALRAALNCSSLQPSHFGA